MMDVKDAVEITMKGGKNKGAKPKFNKIKSERSGDSSEFDVSMKMMGYRNLGHNKKVGWQDGDLQDCHTIPIERKMPVPPSP
ncbi:hypothetical protein PRIPAC_75060 [Pristionchus pacificus]|uniref:Uncharacterized protein n=1 Tax=Pristionchus pacificus TaxID=54126 RepID=A0A2A6C6R9_PRIPA|nr:hypothetical protein PRIPAC_75060 [Pristionchus pacificus]|eukprot:PDM73859.1 hypothetical protein PRIPAC_41215 [Pristionchus pacificus]